MTTANLQLLQLALDDEVVRLRGFPCAYDPALDAPALPVQFVTPRRLRTLVGDVLYASDLWRELSTEDRLRVAQGIENAIATFEWYLGTRLKGLDLRVDAVIGPRTLTILDRSEDDWTSKVTAGQWMDLVDYAPRNMIAAQRWRLQQPRLPLVGATTQPIEPAPIADSLMEPSSDHGCALMPSRKSDYRIFDVKHLARAIFNTDPRVIAIVERVSETVRDRSGKGLPYNSYRPTSPDGWHANRPQLATFGDAPYHDRTADTDDRRARAFVVAWQRERALRHEALRRAVRIFRAERIACARGR